MKLKAASTILLPSIRYLLYILCRANPNINPHKSPTMIFMLGIYWNIANRDGIIITLPTSIPIPRNKVIMKKNRKMNKAISSVLPPNIPPRSTPLPMNNFSISDIMPDQFTFKVITYDHERNKSIIMSVSLRLPQR